MPAGSDATAYALCLIAPVTCKGVTVSVVEVARMSTSGLFPAVDVPLEVMRIAVVLSTKSDKVGNTPVPAWPVLISAAPAAILKVLKDAFVGSELLYN